MSFGLDSWQFMPQVGGYSDFVVSSIEKLQESDPKTYTNEKIISLILDGFVEKGDLQVLIGSLGNREAAPVEQASVPIQKAAATAQLQLPTIQEHATTSSATGVSGASSPSSEVEQKGTPGSVDQYQIDRESIYNLLMQELSKNKQNMVEFLVFSDSTTYTKESIIQMFEKGSMTNGTLEREAKKIAKQNGVSFYDVLTGSYASDQEDEETTEEASLDSADLSLQATGGAVASPLTQKLELFTQDPSAIPFRLQLALLKELRNTNKITLAQAQVLATVEHERHLYEETAQDFNKLSSLIPGVIQKNPGLLLKILREEENQSPEVSYEATTAEAATAAPSFRERVGEFAAGLAPAERSRFKADVEKMARAKKGAFWLKNPSLTPLQYQIRVLRNLVESGQANFNQRMILQNIDYDISQVTPIDVEADRGVDAKTMPKSNIERLLGLLSEEFLKLVSKEPALLQKVLDSSQ